MRKLLFVFIFSLLLFTVKTSSAFATDFYINWGYTGPNTNSIVEFDSTPLEMPINRDISGTWYLWNVTTNNYRLRRTVNPLSEICNAQKTHCSFGGDMSTQASLNINDTYELRLDQGNGILSSNTFKINSSYQFIEFEVPATPTPTPIIPIGGGGGYTASEDVVDNTQGLVLGIQNSFTDNLTYVIYIAGILLISVAVLYFVLNKFRAIAIPNNQSFVGGKSKSRLGNSSNFNYHTTHHTTVYKKGGFYFHGSKPHTSVYKKNGFYFHGSKPHTSVYKMNGFYYHGQKPN